MDHLKESNCKTRLDGTLVNNLRFEDGIDLIDENSSPIQEPESLQEQVEKTRAATEQTVLIVSIGKTQTVVFEDRKIGQEIQIGGKNIENEDKFQYLKSLITWYNNCSEETRR